MSNIDKQSLREAAEKAGSDKWQAKKINGDFYVIRNGSYEKQHGFTSYQPIAEIEHKPVRDFVAAANPATVLALLDELEAKDNRINRLEAIVSVAEQRNALMREWKRALKVPCDLVDDQVPVVIHGMVIRLERLKDTEAKLEAAEERYEDMLRQARSFREAHDSASVIIRKLERNKATVTLPTTRLWAGKIACYEETEVLAMLEVAGINIAAAGKGE